MPRWLVLILLTASLAATAQRVFDNSISVPSGFDLVAALAARVVKAATFTPGRAAVIDANGDLTAATGSPNDCVKVNGSSGPCGSGGGGGGAVFVDGETPTGAVDGVNRIFTLATTPSAAHVFRNGIRQKAGLDYTITGNTITFAVEATPQVDDVLLVDYRY